MRPFESQIPGSNPGRSIATFENFNNKNKKIENSLTFKPESPIQAHSKDSANSLLNSVRYSKEQQDLWKDFKEYLVSQKQSKSSIRNKIGYAQRFYHILETKDAQDLLKLSHGSKTHTMKALASLSKFLGKYDQWLDIIRKY